MIYKVLSKLTLIYSEKIVISTVSLFCDIDDFCNEFEPEWNKNSLQKGIKKRNRKSKLSLSEVLTIIVMFHMSNFRTFKHYYIRSISTHHKWAFPDLVSYNRFVELMPSALIPLSCYLSTRRGKVTGISFVDSTPIAVCHNRRIKSHKTFKDLAKRGKSSMGCSLAP